MPLHDRRPQLLSLSIKGSSSSVGTDEVHTPLPITPLAYSWNQSNAPLIMTPDTPFFDMSSAGGMFGKSTGSDVGGDIISSEPEWTEEEDEMLQSYLSRPASTRAYPPGTLPPADVLDTMTTQILSRLSRSSSVSSASSTDTEIDVDMDDVDTSPTRKRSGWQHSWSATRARLFRIARLESREALGGHTRNNSESMVPVPKEKLVRPKLVVLGSAGMSRQQHSMDNILAGSQQTIDEAVKLSSALQGKAMDDGSSSVLHSTQDLSSPVTFEFGPSIHFTSPSTSAPLISAPSLPLARNSLNRKAPPAFPSAKGLPRPSLLQRGRSYTGADLARERGHSRTTSASSDEFAGSDDADMSSPMSSRNSLLALPPFRPMMRRSATSPTGFVFPQNGPSPALSATSQSLTDDSEPDPITPLNQTTFPRSAIGLGNRTLTGCSSDSDSTPDGTPAITLTRTSPTSSPIEGSTPRLGSSVSDRDSPMSEFANLTLNPSLPASSSYSHHVKRPTRPQPLPRSLSETQSVSALLNPAGIPSSTSHPSDLNLQLSSSTNSLPMTRPCLSMSAIEDAPVRENKRQRAMPFPGSSAAVFRPRLNPGLKVVVPPQPGLTGLSIGGGLRSPFEHKTPGGSVKI